MFVVALGEIMEKKKVVVVRVVVRGGGLTVRGFGKDGRVFLGGGFLMGVG